MAYDNFDSDDDTGRNYGKSSSYGRKPPGGGSSMYDNNKKPVSRSKYSDNEEDEDDYSARRSYMKNVSSKPPSGRLPTLGGAASSGDSSSLSARNNNTNSSRYNNDDLDSPPSKFALRSKKSNDNNNDSDDSITNQYKNYIKKQNEPPASSYGVGAYDTFSKSQGISSLSAGGRNPRSSSLDRLESSTNNLRGLGSSSSGTKTGGGYDLNRNSKFNSTANLYGGGGGDDHSDRTNFTGGTLNTSMSVRDAKSRSFLVGSLSALNGKGLLSGDELDRHLADRKAKVLICTWNAGGVKKAPSNVEDLVLPDAIQFVPDVYIIGVQEFNMNQQEWEISLQEQIGLTHVKIGSFYHGSVGVCIFLRRELIWFCSIVEFEQIPLRAVQAPSRTKTSVVVSFQLFGTLFCFICSHFAAGEGNLEGRIENYKTTLSNMKLPKQLRVNKAATAVGKEVKLAQSRENLQKSQASSVGASTTALNNNSNSDPTDNFDVVFWFGDLNFLVAKDRERVERTTNYLRERGGGGAGNNYENLTNHDELNKVITEERAFRGFMEARITFEPTYKFDLNSDKYDTSAKCRIPSYCDRILYKTKQRGTVSNYHYDSIRGIKLSDHRPVFGLYEVTIRPGVDKTPLSYGFFDREVFAAGYQKRKMYRACNVGFAQKAANVQGQKSPCVIQ